MAVNFQSVQDALFAFITVAGIAVLFAAGSIAAAALTARDRARHALIARQAGPARPAQASPVQAEHPTQSDDRDLVLR